ncbi:MAG: hypothetical protein JSR98_19455 [Proteobacteria bacterium]|nr:hypothetical protein [Pseudomonadota bacterium]
MRHLAGALSAWAPRIAFGEGRAALPLNGRREAWRPTEDFALDRHFRRLFCAPHDAGGSLLAAVIGAAPMGGEKPERCVVGYLEARVADDRAVTLGPVLISADEFDPSGPTLAVDNPSIVDQLIGLDRLHGLRTGDVVVVGPATLAPATWSALRNDLEPQDSLPAEI